MTYILHNTPINSHPWMEYVFRKEMYSSLYSTFSLEAAMAQTEVHMCGKVSSNEVNRYVLKATFRVC